MSNAKQHQKAPTFNSPTTGCAFLPALKCRDIAGWNFMSRSLSAKKRQHSFWGYPNHAKVILLQGVPGSPALPTAHAAQSTALGGYRRSACIQAAASETVPMCLTTPHRCPSLVQATLRLKSAHTGTMSCLMCRPERLRPIDVRD